MTIDRITIIQQDEIKALGISPTDCIKWVEEGFRMKDEAQMPAKLSVHPQGEDFMTTMPCLLSEYDGKKRFGIKVVNRIEGQVPILSSIIYLYDAKTGHLLAMMDGDWITAMRTGAVATLATRLFQKENTNTYSIIGLGNIARATVRCLLADNKDRQITIRLMRYKNQAEEFIDYFKEADNIKFTIIDNKLDFISEADVVISCVTYSKELLFPDNALYKKGITVIPVHVRGFQNCDLFFDKVYGDDTDQIKNWKFFSKFNHYDELHHVLLGINPGRTSQDERILSYNYGLGIHDILFASKIYDIVSKKECKSINYYRQNIKFWI